MHQNLVITLKDIDEETKEDMNAMFGSLEGEGSRGEESRREWLSSTLFGCF